MALFEKVGPYAADQMYASAGQLCATNPESGTVHWWKGQPSGGWIHVGGPGSYFTFAGTKAVLFGRSPDGSGVWRRTFVPGPGEFEGGFEWQPVRGPTGLLISDGLSVYATDPQQPGTAVYPNLSRFYPNYGTWSVISGPAKTFAAGSHIYRLLLDGGVERLTGQNWEPLGAPEGEELDTIYAGGDEVFATSHPTPATTGSIYRFTPVGWQEVGGPGKSFVVDDSGGLYGISPADGSIWIWEGSPHDWTNLGFQARQIAATGNRMLFAVSESDGTIWEFQPALDLHLLGWCYTKFFDVIRFYVTVANEAKYASNHGKKGMIKLVFGMSDGIITEKRPVFEFDPDGLGPGEKALVGPVEFPFSEEAKYYIGSLAVSHPDDDESANNQYEPTHEERIEGLRGNRFVSGGDLTGKHCWT